MNKQVDWSVPQRQSRSAIAIAVMKALKDLLKFAVPLVLLYLFSGKSSSVGLKELTFLIVPVLAIVNSVVSFLLFRFHISEGNLYIRSGFLIKKNITLPLEKIQAIHINQHWLHQLFRVVKLSFDSSGSEQMEVKIMAIDRYRAEALRHFILGEQQVHEHPNPGQELPGSHIILTLNTNDLLKLCISANHIKAVSILATFLLSVYQSFVQINDDDTRSLWRRLNNLAGGNIVNAVLVLLAIALVLALLISVAGVLLRYYNFRVSRSAKGYEVRSGLLELKEKLVPINKVQYISWSANWVRSQMNLYLLQFHIAGSGSEMTEKQQITVPVTQSSYIEQLCRFYHPLLPEYDYTAIRVSALYIRRQTLLLGVLPALVICSLGVYFWNLHALWALLIIPAMALHHWLFQRKFRAVANEEAIQLTRGVYGITGIILQWHKIQQVGWQQSIYQRKHRLASVKIYSAAGVITIPYIRLEEALRICNYALYKVESSNKNWM